MARSLPVRYIVSANLAMPTTIHREDGGATMWIISLPTMIVHAVTSISPELLDETINRGFVKFAVPQMAVL